MWDVRRAGVVDSLDPDHTTKGARGPTGLIGRRQAHHPAAHAGVVTGLCSTPDGSHWITAGTDNRVRLWDGVDRRCVSMDVLIAVSWPCAPSSCATRHLLVHYPGTYNSARKARQLATSGDHSVLFHPSGSVVQCFDLLDGGALGLLRGHFDSVNAVAYNPLLQVPDVGCAMHTIVQGCCLRADYTCC